MGTWPKEDGDITWEGEGTKGHGGGTWDTGNGVENRRGHTGDMQGTLSSPPQHG